MDAVQAFETVAKAAKSAATSGCSYLGAIRRAYRDAKTGDPMDYYESRLGRVEEGGEALEPGCPHPGPCFCHVPAPPLTPGELRGVRGLLEEGMCNCTSFGDPEFDTKYCTVHTLAAPAADVVPTPNPPAAACMAQRPTVAAIVAEVFAGHEVKTALFGQYFCLNPNGELCEATRSYGNWDHLREYREHVADEVQSRIDVGVTPTPKPAEEIFPQYQKSNEKGETNA